MHRRQRGDEDCKGNKTAHKGIQRQYLVNSKRKRLGCGQIREHLDHMLQQGTIQDKQQKGAILILEPCHTGHQVGKRNVVAHNGKRRKHLVYNTKQRTLRVQQTRGTPGTP